MDLNAAKNKLASPHLNANFVEEISIVGRAARLAGNFDFAMQAYKDVVDLEMEAILEAAEAAGLLQLAPTDRRRTLDILRGSAYRSLNLS